MGAMVSTSREYAAKVLKLSVSCLGWLLHCCGTCATFPTHLTATRVVPWDISNRRHSNAEMLMLFWQVASVHPLLVGLEERGAKEKVGLT